MKNNILKLIVIYTFLLIILCSCKTLIKYKESEPYTYPELETPNQEEIQGIELNINLPFRFTTKLTQGSFMYKIIKSNRDKTKLYANKLNSKNEEFQWQTIKINENNDIMIKYNNSQVDAVILDKIYKPIKIIRDLRPLAGTRADNLLLENCSYYIPNKLIKIDDEWEYEFINIIPALEYEVEGPKYYETNLQVKFKLLGYTTINNTRCALIESKITCNKADTFLYAWSKNKVKGGTMVYQININKIIYLDYKNEKVIYAKSFIKHIAKGSYSVNWGDTPEEAITNVKKEYKNMINNLKTYCAQYFYEYYY